MSIVKLLINIVFVSSLDITMHFVTEDSRCPVFFLMITAIDVILDFSELVYA